MKKIGIMLIAMLVLVTLTTAVTAVDEICEPSDVVLVIDRSGTMAIVDSGETDSRMALAQNAAKYFVDLLTASDTSGLVSFAASSSLDQALTSDGSLVKAAIDTLTPGGLTCISCGVDEAQAELDANSRENVTKAIVFLSDGQPTADTNAMALSAATAAKNEGTILFTIGIGEADHELLREMASDETKFSAGEAADLDAIYENVAGALCTPDEEIPEFGTIAAGLALVGAIAGFAIMRRRD